jgi:hypothetical protein
MVGELKERLRCWRMKADSREARGSSIRASEAMHLWRLEKYLREDLRASGLVATR